MEAGYALYVGRGGKQLAPVHAQRYGADLARADALRAYGVDIDEFHVHGDRDLLDRVEGRGLYGYGVGFVLVRAEFKREALVLPEGRAVPV